MWHVVNLHVFKRLQASALLQGPDWTTTCTVTEEDAQMLKMQESSFLGVEGATSLKAEITGQEKGTFFHSSAVLVANRMEKESCINNK